MDLADVLLAVDCELAWVIEGNLYKAVSKLRNFHGESAVIV